MPAFFAGFHQQHRKLLAADSRRQIDAARAFAQDSTDATYGIVAGVVAEGIVEVFETVDVDHQKD